MIFTILILLALAAGVACGQGVLGQEALDFITAHSETALLFLMFFVGVGVGTNKGLWKQLRRTELRVWLVPVGVIAGSVAGGALCSLLNGLGFWQNVSIGAGMGWYSLSGVMLSEFYGPQAGAAAFLSNIMREFFSFLTIPLAVKYLNGYAAIALAGATSEDTTLPILMRHTSAEMVLYSVLNGVLTSAAVPVLLRLLYQLA